MKRLEKHVAMDWTKKHFALLRAIFGLDNT